MSELKITGQVTKLLPIESGDKKDGSGKWYSQSIVIMQEGQYATEISLKALGVNFEKLKPILIGDNVEIKFNIKGREWQGKYYNDLQIWDIKKIGGESNQPSQPKQSPAQPVPAKEPETLNNESDDNLPF
jgi:hypothetical protein